MLTLYYIHCTGSVLIDGLARPLQAAGLPPKAAEEYVADPARLVGVDVDRRRGDTAR